jgi:hypothetical protein
MHTLQPNNGGAGIDPHNELIILEEEEELARAGALGVAPRHGINARSLEMAEKLTSVRERGLRRHR